MERWLKNTRLLVLITAILLVSGYSALSTLPRAEDPALINRWASITTVYPGASAERVEALVTEELENALRSINGIKTLESQSKPGISVITLVLNDDLIETEPVWSKIRDKLGDTRALLPGDVLESNFDNDHSSAFTYIAALQWRGESEVDLLILGRYAKALAKRWQNLSGTEFVDINGQPEEEILVTLDVAAASALGQSALTLSQLISNADPKNPAGELHNVSQRFQIEVSGGLDSIAKVKRIPVATDENGFITRLEDIADVKRAQVDPPSQVTLVDGSPSVLISARMQKNIRIDRWTGLSDSLMNNFRAELPDNISLTPIFKQSPYTDARLSELIDSLVFGFMLVFIVLFITLGFRSAMLVALSLPITAAFTLGMMKFTGLPINQISVTGLIVSLGIMVDNAIVMIDSIGHYRKQGFARIPSAMKAIDHLWLPLLGSTLTTVLAFAPIFLMSGPSGEFVGAIAITVCFSLIGSYGISLILVSGFAARWLPAGCSHPRWYQSGVNFSALSDRFRHSVALAIRYPKITILLVFIFPFAGFLAAGQLTEQFFPPSDRDMFEIQVFLDPQVSIDTTIETTAQIDKILESTEDIESISWSIGRNFPSFYYNMQGREQASPHFAQAMVKVTDFRAANSMIPRLQKVLSGHFPNAQILIKKLEQGPPYNAPIEVRVYGPNLDTIREISEKIRLIMATTPNVENTRETLQPGIPKVVVKVNEEASALTGLSLRHIASLIYASMTGITQGSVIEETESIPIRVRVNNEQRRSISQLNGLRLPIVQGDTQVDFPLSAIADLNVEPSRGAIPRRNGERVNVIEGYVTAGVLPQMALDAFNQKLAQANLSFPSGYRIEFGGESAERDDSVNKLIANLSMVITLSIAVLVLSFNSFTLSGIIFLVGVQAAGLGLLSVWIFNYPFGFTVIIGLLGLVGLAINAAIVIIAELKSSPDAIKGDIMSIVNAVSSCGRHITSTTLTTIAGFLPLILAGGGFWPPFAIAIAGGTLFATLLSFYFVPSAFYLVTKMLKPHEKQAF